MEIPTRPSAEETQTNAQQRRNPLQEYERKFEQLSEVQKFSKLCSDAGFEACRKGQYFCTLIQKKDNRCNIYAENTRCLEMERGLVQEDGISRMRESVQS